MSKKPNILLLFPDQHRGDWMPYNKELNLRMPNIKKLMDNGVTFTRTITSSPLCAPARACLASGLRYDQCHVEDNKVDYPLDQKTFYSVLKEEGYNVGGVGKFDLHKATQEWGINGWIDDLGELGFTHGIDNAGKWDAFNSGQIEPKDPYMKYLHDNGFVQEHIADFMKRKGENKVSAHATTIPDEAYCDNWLTQNGMDMIRDFPEGQPWFLQVNFTGPHDPWDITNSMKEEWKNAEFPLPNDSTDVVNKHINSIRQNYAAMLENIDRNIGLMLEEIGKRGELDNTIIIYSSDHGEMLGDFDRFGKSRPEQGSVHIPLVVSGLSVKKGKMNHALVELQDLTSTILDFAGLKMQEAEDSISLKAILEGKTSKHRKYQISGLRDWKVISDGQYKLIIQEDQEDRLYDLQEDPWENINIAKDAMETVKRLKLMI